MKTSTLCCGVTGITLLMVSLATQTIAQLDSPATANVIQRDLLAARAERHRKAIADADRVQLVAAQVKEELAKQSSTDALSVTVIKRTEEIEKLARKIRTESLQQ